MTVKEERPVPLSPVFSHAEEKEEYSMRDKTMREIGWIRKANELLKLSDSDPHARCTGAKRLEDGTMEYEIDYYDNLSNHVFYRIVFTPKKKEPLFG